MAGLAVDKLEAMVNSNSCNSNDVCDNVMHSVWTCVIQLSGIY